jgi:phosphoglycolate phosphatase-like HAD superfamily hydrolase
MNKFGLACICLQMAVISLVLPSCQGKKKEIFRSFYHWKTRFSPSSSVSRELQDLNVSRLYIKYFDVDWPEDRQMAIPKAKVEFDDLPDQEIVPTVFITNRTMRKTKEAAAATLADKIFQLIFELHHDDLPLPREIQIDCDWTEASKAAYFALLSRLGTRFDSLGMVLSATIRNRLESRPCKGAC